jgi:hypothetical protein
LYEFNGLSEIGRTDTEPQQPGLRHAGSSPSAMPPSAISAPITRRCACRTTPGRSDVRDVRGAGPHSHVPTGCATRDASHGFIDKIKETWHDVPEDPPTDPSHLASPQPATPPIHGRITPEGHAAGQPEDVR